MKRKLIALILVLSTILSLCVFSAAATESNTAFAEDFENGITKWTKSENSAFFVRTFDTKQLVFIATPEKNTDNLISTYNTSGKYKVEFDLIAPEGEYAGFYFNYSDDKTYYLLKINIKSAYAEVVKKINGGEESSVKGDNFSFGENVTKVTVEYNDGIKVYFNGKMCINSAEKSIKDGKIGFMGKNSAFRIDNVSLEKYKEEQADDAEKNVISNIGMPSTKDTVIDGTTTKSQFESRVADLPEEIPLADLTEVKGEIELFVSPEGSDESSGTKDKPFKTIERAAQEVGYLNTLKPQPKGIVVYLREGKYIVNETININKTFSGTEEHPVFISSYNGEKASLVSGMFFNSSDFEKVTDSKKLAKLPASSRGKVYVTSLSGVSSTDLGDPRKNRLYANGNVMECSRWPNFTEMSLGTVIRGGNSTSLGAVMLDIEPGVEWEPIDTRPFTWEDTGRIYFDGAFVAAWDRYTAFVTIDKEQRRISTPSQSYVNPAVSHPQVLHHFRNIFEEIDMPGEWYLDEKEKKLYLYPFSEDEEYEYYFSCKSNDIMNFSNVENVVINGISIEGSGAKGYVFDGCKNCIVQAGEIKNTKDKGAHFMRCEGCGVLDNYIYNVGYSDTNGIHFDGIITGNNGEDFARILKESIGVELKPKNNFIQNNLVSCPDGTHRALAANSDAGTVMSHNTVSNTYRYAFYQSNSPESIVEYNETAVCPKDIWDAGVIYSIGNLMPMGHHVRNNFFHHMNKGATGIYFDDLSSDTMAYNNVLLDINECGVSIHGGRDVSVKNNIIISTNDAGWVFSGIGTSDDYYANGYPNESLYTSTYMRVAKELDAAGDVYNHKIQERFPRYFERFKQTLTVAKNREKLGDEYVRDEAEDLSRAPSHNYFESNIVVGQKNNSVFTNGSLPTIENYGNFESKSRYEVGFRDVDNYDFYISEDSEIYNTIPTFENIDISTVGIVAKDGRWENLPKIEAPVAVYPINGSKGMVHHEEVTLKWLPQILANKYTVTIATDPEFKNIVLTQETMGTTLELSLPSQGTTYYWKLDAECLLQSVTSDPATSKTYSFTTMSDEEIKIAYKPNLSYFETKIFEAEKFYDSIVEGTEPGEYKAGTKAKLKAVIDKAKNTMNTVETQNEADAECEKFQKEWIKVKMYINPRYVYIDPEKDFAHDAIRVGNRSAVKHSNGEVYLSKEAGSTMYRLEKTGPGDVYCFKVKMDNFAAWMGITPAYNPEVRPRYWMIWSPKQIELQYNDDNLEKQTFYKIKDVSHINFNEWVDVQIGSVMTELGVWNYLTLNGEVIIDFLDTETPIYTDGYLHFDLNSANGGITIKATDTVYEGSPIPSTTPGVPEMKAVYKEEK